MQTFLPYPCFALSAAALDNQRLGKQRLECAQLLRALANPGAGWSRHPAAVMWQGCAEALENYMAACVAEWVRRGFRSTLRAEWRTGARRPAWLGRADFHAAHRSNLLRKSPQHYGRFGWREPHDLPYIWPKEE